MNDIYIDQLLNIRSIRHFLTRWDYIFLFLALTGVATVLMVVFGQPTSLTEYTEQLTSLSPLGQITISFTSGFGTLILSRTLLYFVNRAHEVSPGGLAVWIAIELIFCVSVITLVLWALCGGGKVDLANLAGTVVLGFVGLVLIPHIITYLACRLRETHDELIRLRQLLSHQDPLAQSSTDTNVNFYAKGGRMAFSTRASVALVTAWAFAVPAARMSYTVSRSASHLARSARMGERVSSKTWIRNFLQVPSPRPPRW